jgi:hypothetical protein
VQRNHKNIGGYHGERIDIDAVLRDFDRVASDHGWTPEVFHHGPNFCLTAWRRPARAAARRRIYLSAGIHGDEPAAPLAALRLARADFWPADAEVTLIPCLNPTGFRVNQRENSGGLDLNRDYLHLKSPEVTAHVAWLQRQANYDLCLCLHEDWESHGFYLYELNPQHRTSLALGMMASVQEVCPVDRSPVIEGREAQGGIIRPSVDPRTRPQWPEAIWLLLHKTSLTYTLEAPSDFPLSTRVDALVVAVQAAVANCVP